MGEKELPFPYKYEELKPEEYELINTDFGMPVKYVRLGPKGFLVYKTYLQDAANIYNMPLRPTDVFVATYQRSGTTWAQELVWLVANDLNYEKAAEIPLTQRYPFLETILVWSYTSGNNVSQAGGYKTKYPKRKLLNQEHRVLLLEESRTTRHAVVSGPPLSHVVSIECKGSELSDTDLKCIALGSFQCLTKNKFSGKGFMFFDEDILKRVCDDMIAKADNFDKEKFLEMSSFMAKPVTPLLAAAPMNTNRFIKTHLPMSLLPPKLLDTAKTVYVARDPRDVAVSCYHHARLFKMTSFQGEFKDFWKIFVRDLYAMMPFFEHVKEAWEKRNDPNMLFLFYEDLSKDLPAAIRRVADFFGKQLNEEQITRLCDHLSIENFKNNQSVNFEDLRELGVLTKGETFIRKGKSGGWRAYFDDEMTQQAERWIQDNLRDTDLRFPHMNQ